MRKLLPLLLAVSLATAAPARAQLASVAVDVGASAAESLVLPEVLRGEFTGDLPQIRERGILRALVAPSRTDFFLVGARPRGIFVELLDEYVKALNKGVKRREMRLAVKYVIVPFKELIPALLEGRGDVAVANLTITPERAAKVDFVRGKEHHVDELLVTRRGVEGIETLDDLAGRRVEVLAGSSYAEHLRALSKRLTGKGLQPIDVHEADPLLVTEDLLEMVNAGVIDLTVADDYRARLWAKMLPNIVVREDVKVNAGGTLGWAVRKDNPLLRERLQAISPRLQPGSLIGNTLINRYYKNTRWIKNPVSKKERKKLKQLVGLFRRYGERYGFDWLALAAQGYQESNLDQSVRSPAGAIGIMQLLPSTAKDPNVGIADITRVENNIHAGTKYLAFLRDRYFDDPALAEEDKVAFSWAAYNAGPSKVSRMRRKAKALGLDPNRWFGHVEHAALAVVGQETVKYVRNVYKYYVTYRSLVDLQAARQSTANRAGPPKD